VAEVQLGVRESAGLGPQAAADLRSTGTEALPWNSAI
jgi:hypothetical protein